jgi:hypothetical protein
MCHRIYDVMGLHLYVLGDVVNFLFVISYCTSPFIEEWPSAYMIIIKEILLSKELGKTRRSLRKNIGRRGTSHHFSEKIFKDNHNLEST